MIAGEAAPRVTNGRFRVPRIEVGLATTPGRLRAISFGLIAGVVGLWIVGAVALNARHDAADDVATSAKPLLIDSQDLHVRLAEADAIASRAFLAGSLEPASVRAGYEKSVADAADLVGKIGDEVGDDGDLEAAVANVNAALPVYAGGVASARANNRLGYPVGAAYLRDASSSMQETILPDATRIYGAASARLADDYESGTAGSHVAFVLVVGIGLVLALAAVQFFLFRRTNRVLNAGLVVATVLVLALVAGSVARLAITQNDLVRAQRDGSDAVQVFAAARILTQQAQSASTLSVIDRDPDDKVLAIVDSLGGESGQTALLVEAERVLDRSGSPERMPETAARYSELRATLTNIQNALDDRDFDSATALALDDQTKRAAALDDRLAAEIRVADARFDDAAHDARAGDSAIAFSLTVGALLAALAIFLGLRRRIEEYR